MPHAKWRYQDYSVILGGRQFVVYLH